ncbi:MAG: cobalamin-dependent protein [Methanomassiliicoccales archaeon]|jgi:corrinoid protein of di/trimethylamine methyltransferase
MGKREKILAKLRVSVETWDAQLARDAAVEAVESRISPADAIEHGLGMGMVSISQRFDEAKIYLPQVLAASRAMETALEVFRPLMIGESMPTKGTIIIGTVHGDVHEIGKNVVSAFLRGAGYNVIDLGRDVPPEVFIKRAGEHGAEIVGASALMTTTMVVQEIIVDLIKEENLDLMSLFGGAPCNQKWVDSIGGDAYCANGAEVVSTVEKLMKIKRRT